MSATALRLPPTLVALRQAIQAGTISVPEALRIQEQILVDHAGAWHCVTHTFGPSPVPDTALPLAGVALAHKDIFAMRGRLPWCGTSGPVATAGAATPAIDRLESAGGTTMAALAMAEFACGATGENSRWPLPVNPVGPSAAVGGSSSGSGVAVAAGLCYASLGTDTAGSVRIPAATCGILGFKPGYGVLPVTGTHPLAPSLDTVGILARSAQDATDVFSAMLTPPERERLLRHEMPPAWRLASCLTHPRATSGGSPDVEGVLRDFVADAAGGAAVRDANLSCLPELVRCADVLLYAEAATVHAAALRGEAPALSNLTRGVAVPGSTLPATWYVQALQSRAAHTSAFIDAFLHDSDILLTPVLAGGVPDWSQVSTQSPDFQPRALLALFSWTSFVNYLGLPAVSFPVGHDSRGRPVSIQAIGRPGSEGLLLAFAGQAERSRFGPDGFVPTPPAMRI